MMKLIIGCGYLGQRVANAWLAAEDEVWALTRSAERHDAWLKAGIRPVLGDVNDPNVLSDFREPQIDTLLYAVGWDRSSGKSQRDVYVAGLENVLRAIGSRVRRVIYISSTSVYGQDDGSVIDEDSPCEPLAENGRVCLDAEMALRRFCPAANILRLAGIYGPGRLVARVEALRAGTPLAGNPEAWLNMIHVEDAVQAVQACEQRGQPGATYLVSDDEPLPRSAFYAAVCRRVDAPLPTFEPDAPSARGSKTLNKRCSNARLRSELGVNLFYPTIYEGLDSELAPLASGVEEGIRRNMLAGTRSALLQMIAWKFRAQLIDPKLQAAVEKLPLTGLTELSTVLKDFNTTDDLYMWLSDHAE